MVPLCEPLHGLLAPVEPREAHWQQEGHTRLPTLRAPLLMRVQVQVEGEDRAVAAVCAGTVVSTVLAVLYIIHVFRTTPIGLMIAINGRSGYD